MHDVATAEAAFDGFGAHLRSVYAKLAVRSRVELTRALHAGDS